MTGTSKTLVPAFAILDGPNRARSDLVPTFCVPRIREKNYDAFRRILKDGVPQTLAEWRDRQLRQEADLSSGWESPVKLIEVEIDPDEFTRFCDRTKSNYTVDALNRFATEKGLGKND
jgi:hypothetical protein